MKRTDLDEDQKAEMILFDNRAGETSEWENAKTAAMLLKLKDNGVGLETFGFNEADLEHMRLNGDHSDDDFNQFFTPNSEHHKSDPTKFILSLTFEAEEGKGVLETLKEINDDPAKGLIDLISMAKGNKLI